MKHFYTFFVIALFSVVTSFSQENKILFIGNSYTNYNNLPNLVNEMATSTGIEATIEMHAPGGTRFMNHAQSAQTLAKINSDQWDYVVLQAQSQEPSWGDQQVADEVFPYAEILCNQIRENNACSRPVFFTTWGRENGDAANCQYVPEVCTFEGMNNQLINNYTIMANDNEGFISPVAVVWASIRENYPEYELYTADESHPSLTGSYLAACTFYTILFQQDPTAVTFNSTLDAEVTANIKTTVKELVFEDLENWNVNIYSPVANFVYTENENNEVVFTNNSGLSENYSWDFGDGSEVSTEENPTHVFVEAGTYTVTLTAEKCGETSTSSIEIVIEETLSVEELNQNKIKVFPTQIVDKLNVQGMQFSDKIIIHNTLGKIIYKNDKVEEIDFRKFSNGIYYIKIVSQNNEEQTFKVIKE
ncbi:PKD domain-containing protein [Aureivirga sp. CE67]|uniref:PKD domain-containing protein n=1 Tax=Aureivirga sp. CE67 TaxID=1788983 RepID=UPI0018CAA30C|nr:PKD domain-containing protein [Aureivirga sp. CE67]